MENKDYSMVFNEAIKANIANDFEKAFELFGECFDHGFNSADCAAALGLIRFNHYNDISGTYKWFNKAAELGCRDSYVYKYLQAILGAQGGQLNPKYQQFLQSYPPTNLNRETLEKIYRLAHDDKNW